MLIQANNNGEEIQKKKKKCTFINNRFGVLLMK